MGLRRHRDARRVSDDRQRFFLPNGRFATLALSADPQTWRFSGRRLAVRPALPLSKIRTSLPFCRLRGGDPAHRATPKHPWLDLSIVMSAAGKEVLRFKNLACGKAVDSNVLTRVKPHVITRPKRTCYQWSQSNLSRCNQDVHGSRKIYSKITAVRLNRCSSPYIHLTTI